MKTLLICTILFLAFINLIFAQTIREEEEKCPRLNSREECKKHRRCKWNDSLQKCMTKEHWGPNGGY